MDAKPPKRKFPKRDKTAEALRYNQNARKHDPEELAIKLDEWSKRADARWIGDFAIQEELDHPDYFARFSAQSELFAKSLRQAKLRIASRIRNQVHTDKYNISIFHREIGMYDPYIKAHDREEKEFEAQLKTQAAPTVSEEAQASATAVLDMLTKAQKKKSS